MKKIFFLLSLVFILVIPVQAVTLKECLDIALAKNPQMTQARELANSAYARYEQAFGSGILPKLNFDGSGGQVFTETPSIVLPAALGGGTFKTGANEPGQISSYSLTLRQNLFAGGKIIEGVSIANLLYKVAREEFNRTRNDTLFNVTSAYYDVLKAKKNIVVIDQSITILDRNLRQTQYFYDAGIVTNVDLLRVKTQMANLRINKIQAENGLRIARLVLDHSLGQPLLPGEDLAEVFLNDDYKLPVDHETVLKQAFENRPEWKALTLGVEMAERAVPLAAANYLPNVGYVYSNGRTKSEYPTASAYNSDLGNWRSMLVASWNIFDGFDTYNKVREANSNFAAAKARQQMLKDGIVQEVSAAFFNLQSAIEKISASRVAADLAQEALRTIEISYKTKIASEQYYLETQSADLSAQLNLWSARYDCEVAKAKLCKAVGKIVI